MAVGNAVYPKYKQSLLDSDTDADLNAAEGTTGVYAALVDIDTTAYDAAHQFYSDISSAIVGTPVEITTKTITNGVFDGDNVTFSSVSGATVEAIVLYRRNAGANTTWRLVAYIDTGVTNLPVTPNGGDITVTWNASGIFSL